MEEGPSYTEFKHEPLPDSTTHIRLLQIQDIDSDGHIVCVLTAWAVVKAPDYYALSYTWGSPTPNRQILINGRAFAIGQNCAFTLEQAYSTKANGYFWMDALCIDQNTTQEKSHQVGMMGQIYQRSKHVLACVGPHTKGSISFFRTIDDNKYLLDSIHRLTLESVVENPRSWVMRNSIPKSFRLKRQCLSMVSDHHRWVIGTEFVEFMKRPYFSRIWILQELQLGPTISLCCGNERRPFDHLLAVSMLVEFWVSSSIYEGSLTSGVSSIPQGTSELGECSDLQKSCLPSRDDFDAIYSQRGCLTLACCIPNSRRLAKLLEIMKNFQCTDVRDRLFGISALVYWGSHKPPVPDYGKDKYQVAIQVLQLYLQDDLASPSPNLVVEWPRRLWETFQVNIEEQTVQQAITKRYGSLRIPLNAIPFSYPDFPREIRLPEGDRSYYCDPDRIRQHEVTIWYQSFDGHPREVWYGTQLLDTRHIKKETPRSNYLPIRHLYCSAPSSRHGSDSESPNVEILDDMGRVFAYAPAGTRPSDWLLLSEGGSLCDGNQVMVAVTSMVDGPHGTAMTQSEKSQSQLPQHRQSSREDAIKQTRRRRFNRLVGNHPNYTMIGPAFKNCAYDEPIIHFLLWRYFRVDWNAEDLFLFACIHRNHLIHSRKAKRTPG